MKNRVKVLLLAAGLSIGMLGFGAYAQEASTEAAQEAAVSETEAAAAPAAESVSTEENIKSLLIENTNAMIQSLPSISDENLETMQDNEIYKLVAVNWKNVREEIGNPVSIDGESAEISEDGKTVVVVDAVKYDGVSENTSVEVKTTYTFADKKFQTLSGVEAKWYITYPKSKLFAEAGLNTLLGMGIVFVVLFFLSFLIGRIKLVNSFGKKKEAPAAPAAPAPAPAPVAVEEDVTDDEELIAVIAAAIAAAEQTSTDGFVVRSIRKVNRR